VDDCPDFSECLAQLVRLNGHEARTALDGDEAVKAGSTFRPDLVLLDIGLPGQDGFEVARRLRAQEWGAGATLIAMFGLAIDEQKLREAGFQDKWTKPFDPDALLAILGESAPARSNKGRER
jgi:DNA-binding response OmpR family regulator